MTIMFKSSVPSFGNTRNFSTNVPLRNKFDKIDYLAKNAAIPTNLQGFSNKTFNVLKPNVSKGQIYQSCSDFIKKTNSYPHNLRKEHIQTEEPSKCQSSDALPMETLGVYPNNLRRVIDFSKCDGESGKIQTHKGIAECFFSQESRENVEKKEIKNVENQRSREFGGDMDKAGKSCVGEEQRSSVKAEEALGTPQERKTFVKGAEKNESKKIKNETINSIGFFKKMLGQARKSSVCAEPRSWGVEQDLKERNMSDRSKCKHAESFPPMANKPSSRTKTPKESHRTGKDSQQKRTRDPKKKKQRTVWHKSSMDHSNLDVDLEVEIAVEAVDYIPEPPQRQPTLEEFIKKSTPIQCQPHAAFITDILSPLCINFSTPVYFSVSPPRPEIFRKNIVQRNCVFRKRFPSDCPSEDSISIIFGDIDDTESSDDSLFEEYSDDSDEFSDDDSDCVDMVDGCCHSYDFITFHKKSKKKVRFNDKVTVHPMITWAYAYQASRKGPWEQCVRDRERFKKRVEDSSKTLDKILESQHRERIYKERFQMENDCVQGR